MVEMADLNPSVGSRPRFEIKSPVMPCLRHKDHGLGIPDEVRLGANGRPKFVFAGEEAARGLVHSVDPLPRDTELPHSP